MNYYRGLSFCLGGVLLLFTGAGFADGYNGVEIKLQPGMGTQGRGGYQEHVFLLRNTDDVPRQAVISIDSEGETNNSYLEHVGLSTVLPPHTTVRAKIFQPPLLMPSPRLSLTVDGARFDQERLGINVAGSFNNYIRYNRWYYGNNELIFLVTQGVLPDKPGTVFSNTATSSSSSSGFRRGATLSPKEIFHFDWSFLPVEQWSDSWLAYTGYHGVIVSQAEWEKMSPDVTAALTCYAASGGTLIVIGPVPNDDGMVREKDELPWRPVGFGAVIYSHQSPATYPDDKWRKLEQLIAPTRALNHPANSYSSESLSGAFPIMDNIHVPFRQLFAIMLLFVIVIGPLNIFLLARKKRMIWILWTTPVIAVFFSLAVVLYSFFSEGWYSRVRNNTLTILDENARLAATIGLQGYYCPLPPRGFHFSDSTCFVALGNAAASRGCGIDWNDGQHLSSDWIRSRIPEYFLVRRAEPRRERLQILSAAPDQIEVLNGIGTTLTELRAVDPAGTEYQTGEPVPPGQKAILRRIPRAARHTAATEFYPRKIAGSFINGLGNYQELTTRLRPGTYCAKMEKTPFLPPGIKPGELREFSYLYGIFSWPGGKP